MNLPDDVAAACRPLFDVLPLDTALAALRAPVPAHADLLDRVLAGEPLANRPDLAAGLCLYTGDIHRCHDICQRMEDATGAWWHSIVHRLEGDYANSRYWSARASGHPLLAERPELDPDGLIAAVAAAGAGDPVLAERQRTEWRALFEWCAGA